MNITYFEKLGGLGLGEEGLGRVRSDVFCGIYLVWIVVYFGGEPFCVVWISVCLFPCERVSNFVGEVIVSERICVLGVCHEGCVI